jgi:hypothetical protein
MEDNSFLGALTKQFRKQTISFFVSVLPPLHGKERPPPDGILL